MGQQYKKNSKEKVGTETKTFWKYKNGPGSHTCSKILCKVNVLRSFECVMLFILQSHIKKLWKNLPSGTLTKVIANEFCQ